MVSIPRRGNEDTWWVAFVVRRLTEFQSLVGAMRTPVYSTGGLQTPTAFQSLVGAMRTTFRVGRVRFVMLFQSLVGAMRTQAIGLWRQAAAKFQSLVGAMRTPAARAAVSQSTPRFNPS